MAKLFLVCIYLFLHTQPKRLPFNGGASNYSPPPPREEVSAFDDDGPFDGMNEVFTNSSTIHFQNNYTSLILQGMDMDDDFDSQPVAKVSSENGSKSENVVKVDTEPIEKVEPCDFNRKMKVSEMDLTSGWETVKNDAVLNQSVAFVDLINSELPLTQGKDGEQVNLQPLQVKQLILLMDLLLYCFIYHKVFKNVLVRCI